MTGRKGPEDGAAGAGGQPTGQPLTVNSAHADRAGPAHAGPSSHADPNGPADPSSHADPNRHAGPNSGADGAEPSRDAALLRAHVDGDPDAFAEIVRRHRDRLWAVALRTIGDREDAADAVQDALLSAHRNAARFRGDSAVTTWLHRIVVNACLDRIRRRQAHPTVPLPDGSHADDASAGPEPAAPATDHDTALVVRAALAALPVEQRAALVLVDVQGYPVAEAAAILGVAEGTVKSRCARGRARMAIALGHLRVPDSPRPSAAARSAPSGSGLAGNRSADAAVPSSTGAAIQAATARPDRQERGEQR